MALMDDLIASLEQELIQAHRRWKNERDSHVKKVLAQEWLDAWNALESAKNAREERAA